ncbi:hypothetical protein [Streptomyces sp. NPDC054940]
MGRVGAAGAKPSAATQRTVLSVLRHLPDRREQAEVLRRRLEFLTAPTSFFYEGGEPEAIAQLDQPS